MIRLCTNSRYTDLLFVAHSFEVMCGLPEASRVISRPLPHMGCDQAESFMLNYAEVRPQLSVLRYPPCGHILLYGCACCCAAISQHSGLAIVDCTQLLCAPDKDPSPAVACAGAAGRRLHLAAGR